MTSWNNQAIDLIVLSEQTTGYSGLFGYSPDPAAGNLIFSVAAAAGVDPYGNFYPAGISGLGSLILFGPGSAILIYAGTPGPGTLIGAWASAAGSDAYGNTWPAGLYVGQGQITGTAWSNSSGSGLQIGTSTLTAVSITGSAFTGGTVVESAITFDSSGGQLLMYTTTTTTQTYTSNGAYQWTVPAGVNAARVQCWAASAGGGGGSTSRGGEGGGGAEYAEEPAYPLTPGAVVNVNVGNGGTGGSTGSPGSGGGDTSFDDGGVFANGGNAGVNFQGGSPGTGSVNTIHHDGGFGGSPFASATGGSGGGGSGGPTGAGGNASDSTGSSGTAGGTAGSGGGAAGGSGGNSGAGGSAGVAPGGAGGGAGEGGSGSTTNKYQSTASYAYYGQDVGGGKRNTNGEMYQGVPGTSHGSFPGNEFAFWVFDHAQVESDLSGATVTQATMTIQCDHAWYDSGITGVLGYTDRTSFPSSIGSFGGGDNNNVQQFNVKAGNSVTVDITSKFAAALKNGNAKAFMLGPAPTYSALAFYGYFAGFGGDGPLNLSVTFNTGGTEQAGNGADGKVVITYTSASVLVGSFSPVAGTDPLGNSYPAGLMCVNAEVTGALTATGGSAATPTLITTDGWHTMSLTSGWTAGTDMNSNAYAPQYRLNGDGSISLRGVLVTPSSGTVIDVVWATLPAGYVNTNSSPPTATLTTKTAGQSGTVYIKSTGGLFLHGGFGTSNSVCLDCVLRIQ